MVRASTLPERYRTRLAELMEQFNFTGDELWMATESCRRAIGQVCIRRKPGTIVRVRRGREEKCVLGPCDMISRKSVQRLLHELTDVFKVLEVVHDANQWVPHGGDTVFRHSRTYRLRVDQLEPRETFKEWRIQQKAAHSVTEFPRKPSQPAPLPLPPAPAAPVPERSQPAAEHAHRQTSRSTDRQTRKLTSREGPKLVNELRRLMRGYTHHTDPAGGYGYDLEPDDPRYRAPMSQENALIAACMNLGIPYESAKEHLKLCVGPKEST